jgi:hypothetical protein
MAHLAICATISGRLATRISLVPPALPVRDIPARSFAVAMCGQARSNSRGHPGSELVDRFPAGHTDSEVIKARGRPGSFWVEPQAGRRGPVGVLQGVTHELALLDELDLDSEAQPGLIPPAGAGKISHRQLHVVDASQLRASCKSMAPPLSAPASAFAVRSRPGRPSPQATTPI